MAIVSGYQKMKDYIKQSSGYKLLSRWANANTIECDDAQTVQNKIGGITGISSSLTANSSTQAASTQLTNQLYQNITQLNSEIEALNDEGAIKGLEVREGDGVYITYQDGADTVSKKLGSKNFQLGVSCYSASDTSGSFSQYSYSGIDVSDYSKLRIITGTGLNVTVDNTPAQKEGDYYLLNGNSLSFVIQTRPLGAKVEFELLV